MLRYTIRKGLLISLGAAMLLGWQIGKQAPGGNTYVDSHQCTACHPKIAETYARTGMARSFYQPSAVTRIENFDQGNPYYHERSGTWYSMLQRDGKIYQRRWRVDAQGHEVYVQELSVDYV